MTMPAWAEDVARRAKVSNKKYRQGSHNTLSSKMRRRGERRAKRKTGGSRGRQISEAASMRPAMTVRGE